MDAQKIAKAVFADAVEQGVKKYVKMLQDTTEKTFKKQYPNVGIPTLKYQKGRRYYKVVREEASGAGKSVVAFVDKETGDIYKAANWKAPAKHSRGNVLDTTTWRHHTWHGPYYLK